MEKRSLRALLRELVCEALREQPLTDAELDRITQVVLRHSSFLCGHPTDGMVLWHLESGSQLGIERYADEIVEVPKFLAFSFDNEPIESMEKDAEWRRVWSMFSYETLGELETKLSFNHSSRIYSVMINSKLIKYTRQAEGYIDWEKPMYRVVYTTEAGQEVSVACTSKRQVESQLQRAVTQSSEVFKVTLIETGEDLPCTVSRNFFSSQRYEPRTSVIFGEYGNFGMCSEEDEECGEVSDSFEGWVL